MIQNLTGDENTLEKNAQEILTFRMWILKQERENEERNIFLLNMKYFEYMLCKRYMLTKSVLFSEYIRSAEFQQYQQIMEIMYIHDISGQQASQMIQRSTL